MAIQVLEPGEKFTLNSPDCNVKEDILSISFDKANQKIMAVDVTSYIDKHNEKVVLNVTYSDLPDGTQYQGTTMLDAQAKQEELTLIIKRNYDNHDA